MRFIISSLILFIALTNSARAQDCLTPSSEFADELRTFLTNGASFDRMAAAKSGSHRNMYYVAVYLEVPGTSGWALFAANTVEGFGQFYAVDDIANHFSSLLDGRQTRGEFSTTDPAARRARACLEGASG